MGFETMGAVGVDQLELEQIWKWVERNSNLLALQSGTICEAEWDMGVDEKSYKRL